MTGSVCLAHYPVLLDGEEVWCSLKAGHEGDHQSAWIEALGSMYQFPDQPECWTE